jgi:hypothetical protein
VYVRSIEETHDLMTIFAKLFYRVDAARSAADMYEDFHRLAPKIAVPIRTRVAPSSIATSKSPVIPMESHSCAPPICFGPQFSPFKLGELPEKRAGLFRGIKKRGHGHQANDTDIFQIGNPGEQINGIRFVNSRFCLFPADIYLDEDILHLAVFPGLFVQCLGKLERINGMDQIEHAYGVFGFVGLQMADKMPVDRPIGKGIEFFLFPGYNFLQE